MNQTPAELNFLDHPSPKQLGADHIEWLRNLNAPTCIRIRGTDESRTRAIVTLLHGNEPSGLKAIHRILKEGVQPATNLLVIVAAVNTALYPPLLSHRFLPDEKDLNRCFRKPAETDQEKLAEQIIDALMESSPEAVVDTHNTSAHSEPFAVAVNRSTGTRQISQLFTHKLVVMDQQLGTLIEQAPAGTPIVTVEFGGFMDPRADQMAYESLTQFVTRHHLFHSEPEPGVIIEHPLRLEIDNHLEVHYSASVQNDADLTMINTIDQLNFQHINAGTSLGWLGKSGFEGLHAVDAHGSDHIEHYFHDINGFLTTRHNMIIFMATTDSYVAQQDCLLYFS